MHKVHVNVVLYHPTTHDVERLARSMTAVASEIGCLNVLLTSDGDDVDWVRNLLGQLEAPVEVIHRYDNLGFAHGHNLLLERAFIKDASLALVLNPDVDVEPSAITRFAAAYGDREILAGPPLRRLNPDGSTTELVDSGGIRWTRSGRHFDIDQGAAWREPTDEIDVAGVTGACLFVSRHVHARIVETTGHFFDPTFVAYREDAELGIRSRLVGVSSSVLPVSGFAHVRAVRGSARGNELADLLGVRNRFLLRWVLGPFRPGNRLVATSRDVIVGVAALTLERTSKPGLASAFALRQYSKLKSANLQSAAKAGGTKRTGSSLQRLRERAPRVLARGGRDT